MALILSTVKKQAVTTKMHVLYTVSGLHVGHTHTFYFLLFLRIVLREFCVTKFTFEVHEDIIFAAIFRSSLQEVISIFLYSITY